MKADTLKDLRKQAGLTAKEVAERLGVVQRTICNYESGKREPSLGVIVQLSQIYGRTVEEVVFAALASIG